MFAKRGDCLKRREGVKMICSGHLASTATAMDTFCKQFNWRMPCKNACMQCTHGMRLLHTMLYVSGACTQLTQFN